MSPLKVTKQWFCLQLGWLINTYFSIADLTLNDLMSFTTTVQVEKT